MSAPIPLYKVLGEGQTSFHGGSGKWTKNRWRSVKGEIIPCRNGLHLCRRQDLLTWLGPEIWEAEYEGEPVEADDKVVVRRARIVRKLTWDERTARLFAADCAEYALQYASDDIRPTLEAVIYTVRCCADGQATDTELASAWSAAESAAWSAWSAWSAAESAARSAARSAWSAAWSAAESAARSAAWSAAWSAAESAARSAARSAWSAAWSALTDRLFDYLEGRAS